MTCHTLNGFNAEVDAGEFAVVVAYDRSDADNFWAGLPAKTSGQIFDVQIGSSRPPFVTGSQGQIQVRSVGIYYRIDKNEVRLSPPPP